MNYAIISAILVGSLLVGRNSWFIPCILLPTLFVAYRHKFPKKPELFHYVSAAFLLWLLIYLAPLPFSLLGKHREAFHLRVQGLFLEFDPIGSIHMMAPLSLNAAGTWRFFIYLLALWLIYAIVRSAKKNASFRLSWVLFGCLFTSVSAGLISTYLFPQEKTILWLFKVPNGDPIGSFVNNNHYAYSCILLACSALYQLTHITLQTRTTRRPYADSVRFLLILLATVAIGVAFVGLLTSHSRSGLIAFGAGIAAFALFSVFKIRSILLISLTALASLLFVSLVIVFPSEKLQEKILSLKDPLETKSAQTRLTSWENSLTMTSDFPVVGIGAEAFRTTFPIYQTVNSRKTILYAENEYVQSLSEFGAIGTTILTIALLSLALPIFTSPAMPNGGTSALAIGLLSATMTQSLFDFPLRHPANALALCLLLASVIPAQSSNPPTREKSFSLPRLRSLAYFFGFFAIFGILQGPSLWRLDAGEYLDTADRSQVLKSLQNAPTYAYAWQVLGNQLIDESRKPDSVDKAFELQDKGLRCLHIAANYNPTNYRIWRFLGLEALNAGDKTLARTAFDRAIDLRPYLKRDLEKLLRTE